MDIVSSAKNWAKAEIKSSFFFMLFGIGYLFIAIFVKQMENSPLAISLFIPLMIAGGLLLLAGISFYFSYKSKLINFEKNYKANPLTFLLAEIESTAKTIKTYQNVALKVFPVIILIATLIALFISLPIVRAICIGVIAFLGVLVILDSQALKRMKTYHQHLRVANEA